MRVPVQTLYRARGGRQSTAFDARETWSRQLLPPAQVTRLSTEVGVKLFSGRPFLRQVRWKSMSRRRAATKLTGRGESEM